VKSSVADPDLGSGAFLTPGSGIREWKNSDPGSGTGMNIQDHISESLESIFWLQVLKFSDVEPDPGSGNFLTLDPG
jgi:hypothetical protein